MSDPVFFIKGILLLSLAAIISYHDVRYRRIPNIIVLVTLISGLVINTIFDGFSGVLASLGGCALAFALLFFMYAIKAMGAGDVKLFAAIGSVLGIKFVLPTLLVISLIGGVIAVYTMIRTGRVRTTMLGVMQIFMSFLPGWQRPQFVKPTDRRHTVPFGVAITIGSLVSLVIFTRMR